MYRKNVQDIIVKKISAFILNHCFEKYIDISTNLIAHRIIGTIEPSERLVAYPGSALLSGYWVMASRRTTWTTGERHTRMALGLLAYRPLTYSLRCGWSLGQMVARTRESICAVILIT